MEQPIEQILDAHHLHALVDAVDALIFIKDTGGRYLLVNRQFERHAGVPRSQILGKTDDDLFPQDTAALLRASDLRVIESQQAFQVEQRIELLGQPRRFLCSKFPVADAGGRLYAVCSVANDITAHEEWQAERVELTTLAGRERRACAEAQAALRARDEFLFALSHELRTPLNAMVGWLHILAAGKDRSQAVLERATEGLSRGIDRQRRLVEDLLDIARILAGTFELEMHPVALAAVVEAALATIRTQADAKHLVLRVAQSEEQPWVEADAVRLGQAVSNLLSNAVKFTPEGGEIVLRTALVGACVEIVVADSGEGIDAKDLPFLFERFKPADGSTTRQRSGLGLGLALAKSFVELQGGRIFAHSPGKGQGSTFTISLPAIAMPRADPAQHRAPE